MSRYALDGSDVLLVFDDTNSVSQTYFHGPGVDQILAVQDSAGEVLWALADHQGTVRDWLHKDDTTTPAWHLTYGVFGEILSATPKAVPQTLELPDYSYTGREWDADAELFYYRNRWYDPSIGRFVNDDLIGFAGGDTNLQRYVGNNAPNAVDPNGLEGIPTLEQAAAFTGTFVWEVGAGVVRLPGNIIRGGYSVFSGEAGAALGDRSVQIVQNATGQGFAGSPSEALMFSRVFAGELVGANTAAEGWAGADLATEELLDDWERSRRTLAGGGSMILVGTGGAAIASRGAVAIGGADAQFSIAGAHMPGSAAVARTLQPVRSVAAGAAARAGQFVPAPVKNAVAATRRVLNTEIRLRPRTPVSGPNHMPVTGAQWNQHFSAKYGAENVTWESAAARLNEFTFEQAQIFRARGLLHDTGVVEGALHVETGAMAVSVSGGRGAVLRSRQALGIPEGLQLEWYQAGLCGMPKSVCGLSDFLEMPFHPASPSQILISPGGYQVSQVFESGWSYVTPCRNCTWIIDNRGFLTPVEFPSSVVAPPGVGPASFPAPHQHLEVILGQ